jgi:hypothetical protein
VYVHKYAAYIPERQKVGEEEASAYVSIRAAYVRIRQHTGSIRQHTSAYGQHTSACGQHTSAYLKVRKMVEEEASLSSHSVKNTSAYVSMRSAYAYADVSIRQRGLTELSLGEAYVSIRQHTHMHTSAYAYAYVSKRQHTKQLNTYNTAVSALIRQHAGSIRQHTSDLNTHKRHTAASVLSGEREGIDSTSAAPQLSVFVL